MISDQDREIDELRGHVYRLCKDLAKAKVERDHYKGEAEGLRKAVQFAAPLRPRERPSQVFEGLETIEAILAAPQRSVDPLVDASVRLSRIGAIAGRLIAITRPQ